MTRILLLAAAASVAALASGILAGIGGAFAFTLFTGGTMPVLSPLVAGFGAGCALDGSAIVLVQAWPGAKGGEHDEAFGELIRAEFGPKAFREARR